MRVRGSEKRGALGWRTTPQVPWSDEQWARANQVVQEESKRARVAATFLPLYGPLNADADFVRRQDISYGMPRSTEGSGDR